MWAYRYFKMHFLQKINAIFTFFPNANYVNFHRRGSKGGTPSSEYYQERAPSFCSASSISPPESAAFHLLKGKISGLVLWISNKLLNSVDGAGKQECLPHTSLPLMATLFLTSRCPLVILASNPQMLRCWTSWAAQLPAGRDRCGMGTRSPWWGTYTLTHWWQRGEEMLGHRSGRKTSSPKVPRKCFSPRCNEHRPA